jgi:hypothetical protein
MLLQCQPSNTPFEGYAASKNHTTSVRVLLTPLRIDGGGRIKIVWEHQALDRC